jgi:hypothetical protein
MVTDGDAGFRVHCAAAVPAARKRTLSIERVTAKRGRVRKQIREGPIVISNIVRDGRKYLEKSTAAGFRVGS